MKSQKLTVKMALISMAIGWMVWSAGSVCDAQSAGPSGLSPDLQEVVKLSQARMPDDVIKNYIYSTGKSYRLSADDIIYLNSQGVSSGVVTVLQTTAAANPAPQVPAPAPAAPLQTSVLQPATASAVPPQIQTAPPAYANVPPPNTVPIPATPAPSVSDPAPPPQPAEVNFQYFHDQLAPYGTWLNINGTMYWRPDQAVALDPDWRPYYDMGQWVDTDNGLYWQSDYTWGDIPFHYGRWILYPGMGWLWAPDYTWGPAWVCWRQDEADGAIGWAPLPIGAVFVNGSLMYHGLVVGVDFDFGLGETCFTFVGYDHFHERFFRMNGHEWAHHIDRQRLHGFYAHSVWRNEFRRDDHGRFVNYGIGRDRVEHLTHVERATFVERNPVGNRDRLVVVHKSEDVHGKPGGGPNDQRHSQPNARPGAPAGSFHEQNFGAEKAGPGPSAGKVYRPPGGGESSSSRPRGGERR